MGVQILLLKYLFVHVFIFYFIPSFFFKEKQGNLVSREMKMPLTAPEKSVILQVTTYMGTVS